MLNNEIKIRSPKIELEASSKDLILRSWVDSRSKFLKIKGNKVFNKMTKEVWSKDEYLKDVIKMDLAFNYFETAIFKMTTSVLIRDFFYTFQEYKGKWATTQRYSTQTEMVCSSECSDLPNNSKAFELFIKATNDYNSAESKGNFDMVRELMPLSYQVNWQCSMPIKQFIKYLGVLLKLVGPESKIWTEMYGACYQVPELRSWLEFIPKYLGCDEHNTYSIENCYKLYSEDSRGLKSTMQKLYDNIGNVGSVLYSQLIRHEDTYVLGYPEFIKSLNHRTGAIPNCKLEFPILLRQSPQRKMEMLRVRTEWFAVTDDWDSTNTWAKILKHYIPKGSQLKDCKHLFMMFDSDGNWDDSQVGKHDVDDSLRLYKGYNAYFPNAFQLESRKILDDRIARYGMNPLLDLYCQMFDQGYVKDNPNNKDRLKWEALNN